jgi:hypothetical protein
MDVSKKQLEPSPTSSDGTSGPSGEELIQQLVSASGLPEAAVHQELADICALAGQNPDELTLEQLREAMLTYLQALEAGELS